MKKITALILIPILGLLIYFGGYIHAGSKHIPPHFHANFAVYVQGERIDFTNEVFSEDIAGCSITGKKSPKDRVHLHERNQDIIHIHADWVAWGHFFSNNDLIFSSDFIEIWPKFQDQSGRYLSAANESELNFILNGKQVENPFNRLISSEDKLLISYGEQTDEELEKLYQTVSSNAWEFNEKYDPGSCWGSNENGIIVLLTEWLHSMHGSHH